MHIYELILILKVTNLDLVSTKGCLPALLKHFRFRQLLCLDVPDFPSHQYLVISVVSVLPG